MGKKKQKTCFIIMPITTPPLFLDKYDKDKNHFTNVLEYLFIPAIEKIDYKPLLPETEGSQIIQTDIITKLNTADLVLCDISVLNPNVFFELGIRTALNKPVCLVKDKITEAPFDTSPLKYDEYDTKLHPWQLKKDIPKIVKHLKKTIENSRGKNKLWESFGIKIFAEITEKSGEDSEFSYLKLELNEIKNILNSSISGDSLKRINPPKNIAVLNGELTMEENQAINDINYYIQAMAENGFLKILASSYDPKEDHLRIIVSDIPDDDVMSLIQQRAKFNPHTSKTKISFFPLKGTMDVFE